MADTTALMGPGKRDDWETPPDLFRELNTRFLFGIDVAASSANNLCDNYWTQEDDALRRAIPWTDQWHGGSGFRMWWCNPPYGHVIRQWVERALIAQSYQQQYGVMLLPSRTDTQWFHRLKDAPGVQIKPIKGRLKFRLNGQELDPAPFPSLLAYLGPWL